jgi:ppGpp synthetase/RelA/SpoT-type nucleotidyltranferase
MQDIAGCRAVVRTIGQAYRLKQKYENYANARPDAGPELVQKWTKDYIKQPKPDGYRSIHLVLKYRSSRPDLKDFNGLRIELQIRSQLQHAWAMAVETASAITNQALKSGKGEEEWKQFFKLTGDCPERR